MSVCRDCAFWLYHFPNEAGICTVGPGYVLGKVFPVFPRIVGDSLAIEWQASVATEGNTTCTEWSDLNDGADDIPYIENGQPQHWKDEDELSSEDGSEAGTSEGKEQDSAT